MAKRNGDFLLRTKTNIWGSILHSSVELDLRTFCGLEFGFDILLPDCGLQPLDWIVNQVLAITFLCNNISASRKENEPILSNFCVCNIMVQSHWSKSQAVTLTSTTIRDLIVELDWNESP